MKRARLLVLSVASLAIVGVLIVCVFVFRTRSVATDDASSASDQLPVPVRLTPTAMQINHRYSGAIDEAQWRRIIKASKPGFGDNKVPIVLIYHALKVWGPAAYYSVGKPGSARRGQMGRTRLYLDILLNHEDYVAYSKFTLNQLLVRTKYGVEVVTTVDSGWGQEWGSSHVGKYLQIMSDMAVPSTRRIVILEGGDYTLADVIRDDALRF